MKKHIKKLAIILIAAMLISIIPQTGGAIVSHAATQYPIFSVFVPTYKSYEAPAYGLWNIFSFDTNTNQQTNDWEWSSVPNVYSHIGGLIQGFSLSEPSTVTWYIRCGYCGGRDSYCHAAILNTGYISSAASNEIVSKIIRPSEDDSVETLTIDLPAGKYYFAIYATSMKVKGNSTATYVSGSTYATVDDGHAPVINNNQNTTTQQKTNTKHDLKTVTIRKPKAAKKAALIKWKKVAKKYLKKTKKIQIQYSLDKSFKKGVKTKFVSAKKVSYKLKGLKSKKTYYIRIRGYTKTNGIIHVSKWSSKKAVKIK